MTLSIEIAIKKENYDFFNNQFLTETGFIYACSNNYKYRSDSKVIGEYDELHWRQSWDNICNIYKSFK